MISFASWNIRGLNASSKQREVARLIGHHRVSVCAILENKVKRNRKEEVKNRVFRNWILEDNYDYDEGGRIWVAWDPEKVKVRVVFKSLQTIMCHVTSVDNNFMTWCSFVYGVNDAKGRKQLWEELVYHARLFVNEPWIVLGDFNAVRFTHEKKGGSQKWKSGSGDLDEMCRNAELDDLRAVGSFYTWTNCGDVARRISCKLDRALVNDKWGERFPLSDASFVPPGISDHCAIIVECGLPSIIRRTPFRFFNCWADHEQFKDIVKKVWSRDVRGSAMFRLVSKLKALKGELKVLNIKEFWNISERVKVARKELYDVQNKVFIDQDNEALIDEEYAKSAKFQRLLKAEESLAKQKAKVHWLREGDQNTNFFFKTINGRRNRNRIKTLNMKDDSTTNDNQKIKDEFILFYEKLFKEDAREGNFGILDDLIKPAISGDQARIMTQEVTREEIEKTMFGLNKDKAPGPDGYGAFFFHKAWDIVGDDVVEAIRAFFHSGKLLRELNCTLITLVPKCSSPSTCNDFRPISCCNTIYKCISKIIANRIKGTLCDFINPAQAAFVEGRSIGDNILLCQELVHHYNRQSSKERRCTIKVDLMKAYDTVNWELIFEVMQRFGYPREIINWIKVCISTPKFSIAINGESCGFFGSSRGLRQGDPLSPYLFVIVMEVLSRILSKMAEDPGFRFHWKCSADRLTHLCFADDLMIFCYADEYSIRRVNLALQEFFELSGLKANHLKSTVFMSGISDEEKLKFVGILGFKEEKLPIKYLGVPLITKKLSYGDCKTLIERITARINSWRAKFLSYAGRLVLLKSILWSIQVYWSAIFILPSKVINEIEAKLRAFLWSGAELNVRKAKVAWRDVCVPKKEGGLGIMRLKEWNRAMMMKHVWRLIAKDFSSIWVKWIHSNLIKSKSLWELKISQDSSWAWRHILKLRSKVKERIKMKIGNGQNTFMWLDNWHPLGPLLEKYGPRVVYDSGLDSHAKVKEVIQDSQWCWPPANSWQLMEIKNKVDVRPNSEEDRAWWQPSPNGCFSTSTAWDSIRSRKDEVEWYHLVWGQQTIPRHAFVLWMAIRNKLPTKARVMKYGGNVNSGCCFCNNSLESMDHLFFQCAFSKKIWCRVVTCCGLSYNGMGWNDYMCLLSSRWKKRRLKYYLGKIALAATVYFLWKERNARIFKGECEESGAVLARIKNIVMTRAMDLTNIRRTSENYRLKDDWSLPEAIFSKNDVTRHCSTD